MFSLDPNSRYLDVLERALYNGVLSGVSFDGDEFFYANPLTAYPNVSPHENITDTKTAHHYRRSEWFECPCCPPNLSRTVASIQTYFYSTTADRLYIHLYAGNKAHFELGGSAVQVEQATSYPWDGDVHITVQPEQPAQFDLALRVPGWCRQYSVRVNGQAQTVQPENGYLILSRRWQSGDTVDLTLEMPVERIVPHPRIRQDAGQVALQRGPLVFCLEEVDNGEQLANVVIPNSAALRAEFDANLFGGVSVITGEALRVEPSEWTGEMYQPQAVVTYTHTPFQFRAIPYFLWANREPGEMRVWVREA
jgi:DUF1680 family protein